MRTELSIAGKNQVLRELFALSQLGSGGFVYMDVTPAEMTLSVVDAAHVMFGENTIKNDKDGISWSVEQEGNEGEILLSCNDIIEALAKSDAAAMAYISIADQIVITCGRLKREYPATYNDSKRAALPAFVMDAKIEMPSKTYKDAVKSIGDLEIIEFEVTKDSFKINGKDGNADRKKGSYEIIKADLDSFAIKPECWIADADGKIPECKAKFPADYVNAVVKIMPADREMFIRVKSDYPYAIGWENVIIYTAPRIENE